MSAQSPSRRSITVSDVHPQTGNAVVRWIGRVMLLLMGWRIVGEIPKVPKGILIGAPHTTNWDLPLAIAMRFATGLRYSWMMKAEAFREPFGTLWRALGGVAIDRKAAKDAPSQMADWFNSQDKAFLGITPEGTRSKVERWKTGYLRIAQAADVPVIVVGVDGANRELRFDRTFPLTGDIEADNEAIRDYVRTHYSGWRAAKG